MNQETQHNIDGTSYDKLPSPVLEQLLRDDCDGRISLSPEDILSICEILTDRDQKAGADQVRSAHAAWQRFKTYCAESYQPE